MVLRATWEIVMLNRGRSGPGTIAFLLLAAAAVAWTSQLAAAEPPTAELASEVADAPPVDSDGGIPTPLPPGGDGGVSGGGGFADCNSNGTDDLIDIAGPTSTDCDGNTEPDECALAIDLVLYDSGPLITDPIGGFGGAPVSELQNNAPVFANVLGYGNQAAGSNRVADDFGISNPEGWHVNTITVYAYQTGSTTTSTIVSVFMRIWDGPPDTTPNDTGSRVIWGDTTTNRLVSTSWTGAYRATETAPTGNTRPIMAVVAGIDAHLDYGAYWIDYQVGGTLASGPFAPTVSYVGQPGPLGDANARQFTLGQGYWNPIRDGFLTTGPQAFPFLVRGRLEVDCNANDTHDACDIDNGAADCNSDSIPDSCQGGQGDCNSNGTMDLCEPGYADFNKNGQPDSCDLTIGTSVDCNGDGIPDDAYLIDCNGNGILDICDIFSSASEDCDGNAVPDECQLRKGDIVNTVAGTFMNISGTGTALSFADPDDGFADTTMTFTNALFPDPEVRVGINGVVGFGPGVTATTLGANNSLPDIGTFGFPSVQALFPFWDDLNTAIGGSVLTHTVGTTPNRTYIIQWNQVTLFLATPPLPTSNVTFQVQIFESPVAGVWAQFAYLDTTFGTVAAQGLASNDGHSASIGYQDTGISGFQWSYNKPLAAPPNPVMAGAVLSLRRAQDLEADGVLDQCVVVCALQGDMDSSGTVDGADIQPWVDCVVGGSGMNCACAAQTVEDFVETLLGP